MEVIEKKTPTTLDGSNMQYAAFNSPYTLKDFKNAKIEIHKINNFLILSLLLLRFGKIKHQHVKKT